MEFKNLSAETSMAMSAAYIANHLSNELSNAIIEASECRQLAREYKTELAKSRADALELKEELKALDEIADARLAEILRLRAILQTHGIDTETGQKLPFAK